MKHHHHHGLPETPSPALTPSPRPGANVKRHTSLTGWLLGFAFFSIGACATLAILAYFQS